MRAGDAIGENDWTIWVRGDSVCHSACVLLLAAGDMRVIVGPVGVHRMIRVKSTATSRKELGEELRRLSEELRNYLERDVYKRQVQIGVGIGGEFVIDDGADIVDIQPACGYVAGHQHRATTVCKAYQHFFAVALLHITMQGQRGEAVMLSLIHI